jgi:hypothetical protein
MGKKSKKNARPPKPVPKPPAPAGETLRAKLKAFDWLRVIQVLLIAAAGLWIYWPVLHGTWLWDDDTLISQNDLVHDPYGIWNVWLAPENLIDYFPLTVSLEWLEWQIWPNDPFCYHLTNVILHVCSALLVWRLLSKLGLRLAWLGGLLFVIHPVMVESVAWMAELKNTLSMPPFLLAMCAWIDYDRRGKLEDYCLALVLFLAAMLCKSTMVMFPIVILLYAWWKRGQIKWSDLKNSAAFFVISLAVGLTLIAYLRHGVGEETIPLGGLFSRLACAGLSISFYFSKCFLPLELLPLYPQWVINPPELWQFAPWPVLGGAIYWIWTKRKPWSRDILFGFGFFLINLAPFVGFRTISFMRVTWVMDHFLYLPIIGLLGLVVAALGQLEKRLTASARPYAMGGIAIVMVLLAFTSHRYAKVFISSEAEWTYTIRYNPDAWAAHNDLGNALLDAKRLPEAKAQYEEALKLNPGYPEAHNNLGIVLYETGRPYEALDQFELALKYCPDLATAQNSLAKLQVELQAKQKTVPPTK